MERKGRVHPSRRNRIADGYPEQLRMAALEFRLAETLGGTAKPGWSPRKGRHFESLPRRDFFIVCERWWFSGGAESEYIDRLRSGATATNSTGTRLLFVRCPRKSDDLLFHFIL